MTHELVTIAVKTRSEANFACCTRKSPGGVLKQPTKRLPWSLSEIWSRQSGIRKFMIDKALREFDSGMNRHRVGFQPKFCDSRALLADVQRIYWCCGVGLMLDPVHQTVAIAAFSGCHYLLGGCVAAWPERSRVFFRTESPT